MYDVSSAKVERIMSAPPCERTGGGGARQSGPGAEMLGTWDQVNRATAVERMPEKALNCVHKKKKKVLFYRNSVHSVLSRPSCLVLDAVDGLLE